MKRVMVLLFIKCLTQICHFNQLLKQKTNWFEKNKKDKDLQPV